ncbi:MAG: hypothetical protein M3Z09_18785 [Acidobacteriota bacterium]|nr:hypothetical protein [Acidobacteriota bacterium]
MEKGAAILYSCISVSALAFSLTACGRYADFSLPVLAAGPVPRLELVLNAEPVLGRGDWDSSDVLNPSVVIRQGQFYNFYSGFDGRTWHTGLATSSDGVHWRKRGKVLSPDPKTWEGSYIAANGSAVVVNGEFWYWYQAGGRTRPRIGLARSKDGEHWTRDPAPVLSPGPYASWDEQAVADPFVFRKEDWFYLYYLGQNRARQQQLGLARSRDGVHWQKLRANPILRAPLPGTGAMDENGLGEPAAWENAGLYWMLFTGRDSQENRSLALAYSRDGVQWQRTGQVFRGQAAWDGRVLCDATVLGGRVWFGGGDRASPDENLQGQIGVGYLK